MDRARVGGVGWTVAAVRGAGCEPTPAVPGERAPGPAPRGHHASTLTLP